MYDDLTQSKNKKQNIAIGKDQKTCPICGRLMIEGNSIDRHHFIPKLKKGKETTLLHVICHRKLHSLFSESEMARYYNTPEKCKDHPEVSKFVKWLKNKHPEYIGSNKENNNKNNKRKK